MPNISEALSVVVPTFKEVENLPALIERLQKVRRLFSHFEILIIDDDSRDGSAEFIQSKNIDWINIHVRKKNKGLSQSVIDGIQWAKFDYICVMDADLSHPPEAIPAMLEKLIVTKADMVVGSRYVEGGRIDLHWSLFRHFTSQLATLLARPFTSIKDPMSGFFVIHKKLFREAVDLDPIGYKIALELIVKGHAKRVEEFPIHFADRVVGASKLGLKEQLNYLRHIRRLLDYKWRHFHLFRP